MILNIFIHRNNTECNTAMMKITINMNTDIPALMQPTPMHYELCFLHVAHTCPDNRQSSRSSFTVTVTLYIWVTHFLKPTHGNNIPLQRTYQLLFLFATPSSYFWVTPSYIWVTQNTTLATSNTSNDISLMGSTI